MSLQTVIEAFRMDGVRFWTLKQGEFARFRMPDGPVSYMVADRGDKPFLNVNRETFPGTELLIPTYPLCPMSLMKVAEVLELVEDGSYDRAVVVVRAVNEEGVSSNEIGVVAMSSRLRYPDFKYPEGVM